MGRWSPLLARELIDCAGIAPGERVLGPFGDYVKGLASGRRDALAAAVRRAHLAGRADGPRSLAATAWTARGIK